MRTSRPDIARSTAIIGDFIYRHGIEYSRFVRLRSRRAVFKNLNERRLREWIPLLGTALPQRKPQRSTQASLVELATWIATDETTLLRALGIKPRLSSSEKSIPVHHRPAQPSTGSVLTASEIAATALRQAEQGYANAAIQFLTVAFRRYLTHEVESAMSLLPTALYLLYRYSSPHDMATTISTICDQLRAADIQSFGDPIHRDLSLAQIACALNERGQGVAAGQLFFCPEVRRLSDAPLMGLWPKTQLLRNIAAHWVLHGHRAHEAIAHVQQANHCDPESLSNLRAGATICCQTIFTTQRNHCSKAWEVIEPYYEDSRQLLVTAAESQNVELPDVLHLYSGLYFGALARSLSGKRYPARSEMQADLHALRWCQAEFGPIQIDDALVGIASRALPPELQELRQACLRPPLSAYQADTFLELQKILLKKWNC